MFLSKIWGKRKQKREAQRVSRLESIENLEPILRHMLGRYQHNPKYVDDAIRVEERLRELRSEKLNLVKLIKNENQNQSNRNTIKI